MFFVPLGNGPISIPTSFFLSIIFDAMSIALRPFLNLVPYNINPGGNGLSGVGGANAFLNKDAIIPIVPIRLFPSAIIIIFNHKIYLYFLIVDLCLCYLMSLCLRFLQSPPIYLQHL